jgi:hypothetical protein
MLDREGKKEEMVTAFRFEHTAYPLSRRITKLVAL